MRKATAYFLLHFASHLTLDKSWKLGSDKLYKSDNKQRLQLSLTKKHLINVLSCFDERQQRQLDTGHTLGFAIYSWRRLSLLATWLKLVRYVTSAAARSRSHPRLRHRHVTSTAARSRLHPRLRHRHVTSTAARSRLHPRLRHRHVKSPQFADNSTEASHACDGVREHWLDSAAEMRCTSSSVSLLCSWSSRFNSRACLIK